MFTEKQLQKIIENSEFLGSGVSRSVFAISDNVVVKVNTRPWDFSQNDTEYHFYDRWYNAFNDLLPEMYGYINYDGYWYLFMEKVEPLDWYDAGYDGIYDYIKDNYSLEESHNLIERFVLFENVTGICDSSENECNWGLRDGYPVLLDCGLTVDDRYDMYDYCSSY